MTLTEAEANVWDLQLSSTLPGLLQQLRQARADGQTIVTTNGCFDLLHVGHVRFLGAARRLGDRLVVGLNSDESVVRLKGGGRPIVPQEERAVVLRALRAVDDVVIFHDTLPIRFLSLVQPHIHCKAADYRADTLPEADAVCNGGGRIEILPMVQGRSTSYLIRRLAGEARTTAPRVAP
ncbi:adenylyltransferase/cytidyltransferase family protein [Candidatus Latescibacterota bacterium]